MERKGIRLRRAVIIIILILFLLLLSAAVAVGVGKMYFQVRGHGNVTVESYSFTESAGELQNPNRGFYHMHGFRISDEATDFRETIADRFCRDTETKLTLIEINLQEYRDKPITQEGLDNLEALFESLETVDKQLMVRFLYDWNGENEQYEPESIDLILEHMRQVGPVLQEHKNQLFLLQGIFIGNWGEMNGTKYLETEDMRTLAAQLAGVTDASTFLSVRMPAQWRKITQLASPADVTRGDGSLAARLGLFNDGMLGSWSDYGTYGEHTAAEDGPFTYWNREEELAFQEELCKLVPNGGEVIADNPYNDFENAVDDLAAMHVTYLNRDYDTGVLDKWAASTVTEEGCFNGMDGLSYIERHLGYRLLIRDTALDYDFKGDILSADITIQNVGFAPVYREADVRVILYNEEGKRLYSYAVAQELRELPGGKEAELCQTMHVDISMAGESPGNFTVYFDITDSQSGQRILLANEQDAEEYGYPIGSIRVESAEMLWDEWKEKHFIRTVKGSEPEE